MRFNPRAGIDQSQVENRSGGGLGGGGMRLPIPGGGGGGGGGRIGLGGLLLVIVLVVVSQCLGVGPQVGGADSGTTSQQQTTDDQCRTGADANRSESCAIDLLTNSVQGFWATALPQQTQQPYQVIRTVKFSGQTDSACGTASAQMGPFYCPNDKLVYLDTTFFRDMLQGQLGAKGGPFAIGYVLAHEYGHHVQDQLGYLGRIRTQRGPTSDSVRAELMADCLGGVWAKSAQQTTDAGGQPIITDLTQDDVRRAIDAAQAVGDDRIQKETSGRVDQEQWTHGSAAQRTRWFDVGLRTGQVRSCDTFAADAL